MQKNKNSKSKKKSKKVKKSKLHSKNLNLIIAKKQDFLQVIKYKGNTKVWGIIHGVPYWMINSKGEIENRNYILDENTDLNKFAEYVLREQILITKN